MQVSAIKNSITTNYQNTSPQKQGMTNSVKQTELPSFADAKSLVNVSFTRDILGYALDGDWDGIKSELDKGVSVNYQDYDGYSALFWTCYEGHIDLVEKLLEQPDINVNVKTRHGGTPLYEACNKGHKEVVAKLLEHPDILVDSGSDYNTPLERAERDGNADIVQMLRSYEFGVDRRKIAESVKNSDINACYSKDGYNQLHRAVLFKNEPKVDLLLKNPEVDVNRTDKNEGQTPLILAVVKGHDDIAKKLIECPNIDINKTDSVNKQTALMWAIRNMKTDLVEKILQHPDLDINKQDKFGRTALHLATIVNLPRAAEKILEHPDVDVLIKDSEGKTADCYNFKPMISSYQRGVDRRRNVLSMPTNIPVDINKLSPEQNIWSEEEIGGKFKSLICNKDFRSAEKMMEETPLINLEGDDNPILVEVCSTGKPAFVQKVFDYRKAQPEMRAEYDKRRKDYIENTIPNLSYDELKENLVALNTPEGFKLLMDSEQFNPNDKTGKNTMFEYACKLDKTGNLAKEILSKFDDVDTKRAKASASREIREMVIKYETQDKYKLKFDNIKRNLFKPETKELAVNQLKTYIDSEDFNPDMTDSFGNSALHIVASMPDDSARGLIQKLLTKGVKLNSKNITSQNALISAIKAFRIADSDEDKTLILSNIKFLLDKGLDVNEPDSNGQTAFHHACCTTSVALLNMILAKNPHILEKDKLGHKGGYYLSTPQMKEVYYNYVS